MYAVRFGFEARRWSEPDNDQLGMRIDLSHHSDLVHAFMIVVLFDTQVIDPQPTMSGHKAILELLKWVIQILTDLHLLTTNFDDQRCIIGSPDVRERPIWMACSIIVTYIDELKAASTTPPGELASTLSTLIRPGDNGW